MTEFISDRVSNCCEAPIYSDTDVCTDCKEHSQAIDMISEEANEWAREAVLADFKCDSEGYDWVRESKAKGKALNTVADLKHSVIYLEIEVKELKETITKLRRRYE